jgi:hypothetical protein
MALEQEKKGLAPVGGEIRPLKREAAPEQAAAPEAVAEEPAEQAPEPVEAPQEPRQNRPKEMPAAAAEPIKDARLKEIEAVLSDDLGDLYNALPPEKKVTFRKKGEETAEKLLLLRPKGKQEKAYALIKDWLKMIPGTNKFYLEQEAKIKTDKLYLLQ